MQSFISLFIILIADQIIYQFINDTPMIKRSKHMYNVKTKLFERETGLHCSNHSLSDAWSCLASVQQSTRLQFAKNRSSLLMSVAVKKPDRSHLGHNDRQVGLQLLVCTAHYQCRGRSRGSQPCGREIGRGTGSRRLLIAPADQQTNQSLSEVSSCRNKEEEVAGVVRYRQNVDDVLDLSVAEVSCPREVSEHLTIVHTQPVLEFNRQFMSTE